MTDLPEGGNNQPYDQIVQGLMLTELDGPTSLCPISGKGRTEEQDTAMSVAHAFLGIQLQCRIP